MRKNQIFKNSSYGQNTVRKRSYKLWQAVCLKEKHAFPCVKTRVGDNPLLPICCNSTTRNIHERFQTLLTPVLTIFTDFMLVVVTSEIAQILSLYGGGVFSSEVEQLKWFCFEKKKKKAVTIQCVLPTRPSQDGKCHWSVLEN